MECEPNHAQCLQATRSSDQGLATEASIITFILWFSWLPEIPTSGQTSPVRFQAQPLCDRKMIALSENFFFSQNTISKERPAPFDLFL